MSDTPMPDIAPPDTLQGWLSHPLTDAASAQQMFTALLTLASQRGVPLRTPPPEPTTCCGRGCNGCVWEGFFTAALYWRDEASLLLSD